MWRSKYISRHRPHLKNFDMKKPLGPPPTDLEQGFMKDLV